MAHLQAQGLPEYREVKESASHGFIKDAKALNLRESPLLKTTLGWRMVDGINERVPAKATPVSTRQTLYCDACRSARGRTPLDKVVGVTQYLCHEEVPRLTRHHLFYLARGSPCNSTRWHPLPVRAAYDVPHKVRELGPASFRLQANVGSGG
eukprot:scaffold503_cov365-Prasinococcus_capsulatus_cf.AAC.7